MKKSIYYHIVKTNKGLKVITNNDFSFKPKNYVITYSDSKTADTHIKTGKSPLGI